MDSNGNGAALLSTTSSEFSDCSLQVSHLATGSTLCLTLHTFYIALRLGTSWLCSILSASAGQLSSMYGANDDNTGGVLEHL